jgi:hypothetical protein
MGGRKRPAIVDADLVLTEPIAALACISGDDAGLILPLVVLVAVAGLRALAKARVRAPIAIGVGGRETLLAKDVNEAGASVGSGL